MDIFDCHLCGCKKVGFDLKTAVHDTSKKHDVDDFDEYSTIHHIIQCRQCLDFFYEQVALAENGARQRILVYPAIGTVDILESLAASIKKPYISAVKCMEAGITDAASTMLRKAVYMICIDQKVDKSLSGDEKIKSLVIPQELKDVFLNIKGIGDWGGHEDFYYSPSTLKSAKEALDLVIKYLYEFPEMLKVFVKDTAKEKGQILKDSTKEINQQVEVKP
jgi:hypothetical protein